MAVTGTGTQADPYIVSTWDEIAEYVAMDSVYVKCSPNLIFNMNTMFRTGAPSLNLHCTEFDGNGLEIRSGYWNSVPAIVSSYSGNSGDKKIKNMKILSSYTTTNIIQISASNAWTLTLDNVIITGFHTGLDPIFRCNQYSTTAVLRMLGCSINVNSPDGSLWTSHYSDQHPFIQNTYIKFNGNNFCKASGYSPNLNSCRVDGRITQANDSSSSYIFNASTNSIINASGNDLRISGSNAGAVHVLYNSDLLTPGSSIGSMQGLTTAQLKNPQDVAATGFPVYVEE